MSSRILVFGSINTDLVVYVDRLPLPGETVVGRGFASFPGGKGANQAVAAARAGAAVEMFGCLGDDEFGRERLASLKRTGVSVGGVKLVPGIHSGIAQITVDANGENTIATAPGANLRFEPSAVEIPRAETGERLVSLFQNEIPQSATEDLIRRAKSAGHLVLWNVAPAVQTKPLAATLTSLDFLICNGNELSMLTAGSTATVEQRAHELLSWGVPSVIITLGREGSLWVSGAGTESQHAFPVEAVDTVGAGDCFCGVFAALLAEGKGVRECLRGAAAAAAISCTVRGAQDSMPRRAEIERVLRLSV